MTATPFQDRLDMLCDEQPSSSEWRDFFETDEEPAFDEALRLVKSGQSVFLQGYGGTGRTFAAKEIAKFPELAPL